MYKKILLFIMAIMPIFTFSQNTFYGANVGDDTNGSNNNFYGTSSGSNSSGILNVLFGHNSGINNTGDGGVFVGGNTGELNTGDENTFIGVFSGRFNSSGQRNTFIGARSGINNTTGKKNTFVGWGANANNLTGDFNTSLGYSSGYKNLSGTYNVSVGLQSGYENTSGAYNTNIGTYAGSKNETGVNNTMIGAAAGYTNASGSGNVFLGFTAGREEQGSNKLYIENTNSSSPLIWGDFATDVVNVNGKLGVGTTAPDSKLDVRGVVSVGDESIENRFKIWAGGTGNANHMRIGTDYAHYGDAVLELYQNYGGGTEQNPGKLIVNGNIGIGTVAPSAKMHINTINSNGNYNTTFDGNSMNFENGGQASFIRKFDTGRLFFSIGDTNNYVMSMSNNGNIGIGTGTDNPDEKLTVKGKIHTEEVRVDLMVPGPDYVFEKYFTGTSKLNSNYEMPTLEEVEAYTKANHHLPEIPSAQEMKDNGIQLKEMNLKLLQKIEELTLYTIQQQKELDDQKNKNKTLEDRLEKIEKLLESLEE